MDEKISALVRNHLNLLQLERDENLQHIFSKISSLALRNLEKEGEALSKLSIGSLASRGLKQLQIDFVDPNNLPLKHGFNVGDLVVCIQANNRTQLLRGLVSSLSERSISVALTDQTTNVNEEEQFALVKADSDYTYECQTRALSRLESTDIYSWRCFNIIRILFDDNDVSVVQDLLTLDIPIPEKYLTKDGRLNFINVKLAQDQRDAVDFALRRKYIAIIQGPPGTGKTTTLVELIGQLNGLEKRIRFLGRLNFINAKLAQDQRDAVDFALRRKYIAIIQGPPGTGKTTTLVELIGQLNGLEKRIRFLGRLNFINVKLAQDQRDAVDFALRRKYIAIIQGPPGTGKTTTLVELIGQLNGLGKKVLVCAPTNVAVDNVALKLCEAGIKPLRMGHPARIAKQVQSCSVDANVRQDNAYEILVDIKKSLQELQEQDDDRGKPWAKIKELNREYRERIDKLTSEIIRRHSVILCTLNSSTTGKGAKALRHVPRDYFDVVVVDEASQALEASNWIAIPNAEKLVLAGDINQLPPAVMNQKAANGGLSLSLMERAIKKLGKESFRSLKIQYRMNRKIMSWSSEQFYQNTLEADKLVANHLLKDLSGVEDCALTNDSLLFVDTCGCECEEYQIGSGTISKGNVGEAIVVERIVLALVKAGVPEKEIGVITPYALQVDFIRRTLSARSISAEVSTVDGFQGREKEVIILSLVRSNDEKSLGFVTDFRRLNVAVTRARRLLAVIVNSETVEDNKLITSLLKHVEDNGVLQTAQEYLGDDLEDVKKELEGNVRAKQKASVSDKAENSKVDKRKKPNLKNEDKIKEDNNLKSVLKDKGIGLSINSNRKDYNPFECISENTSDVEFEEDIVEEEPTVEETREIPPPEEEKKSKPVIEVANLIASLKQLEKTSAEASVAVLPVAPPRQSKKKKKGKNPKPRDLEIADEDDFDKLIASVTANDYRCAMSGCKKSTNLMHVDCEFCKSRFCLKHGMQEIHGCGQAVRKKERKEFVHPKPEGCQQKDKDKFARKLKQLEEARKPKKKVEK